MVKSNHRAKALQQVEENNPPFFNVRHLQEVFHRRWHNSKVSQFFSRMILLLFYYTSFVRSVSSILIYC